MKTSLWIVITLVTGIVGFLMGYSVSGYTGTRNLKADQQAMHADPAQAPKAPAAVVPARVEAGGYGAVAEKPAAAKPAAEKPATGGKTTAAGY